MAQLNIRQLISGGIITNYFCSSSCGHCLYNCSPRWEKDYISPEAARRAGVGIFPWVTDFISDLSQFDPNITHSLAEFSDVFGQDYMLQVLKRYWIHMGGRALKTYRPLMGKKTFQQVLDEPTANCYGELSNTNHFHIDLFGNYIPGLCSGLSIAIEDLGKPLSDETYPILTTLGRHGVRGLVKLAEDRVGYIPKKGLYINKCDLCTEVRTFLVQNDYSGSNELSPAEFYRK